MARTSYTGRFGQLGVIGLLLAAGLTSPARAEEPTKHVFRLDYARSGLSVDLHVEVDTDIIAFEKEPDFGDRDIVRGYIQLGIETKERVSFAWDKEQTKLYVDLNRNLDLTDDTNGVFTSRDRHVFQQIFREIPIELERGGVRLPYLLEMYFYSYRPSQLRPSAKVHSGFSGEIDLYGKKWHVGIADDLDGSINWRDRFLLRPSDGQSPDYSGQMHPLNVPTSVSFDGRNYALSFEFAQQEGKPVLQVTFSQQQSPMGRLDVQGKFIKHMVLEDGHSLVVLDRPEGEINVPVGEYRGRDLLLDGGPAGLLKARRFSGMNDDIRIREGQATALKVGGPLDNSVKIQRAGNVLKLDYRLVGVGGLDYQRLGGRSSKAPSVAIYKGERKIASGTFEYG